MPFASPELQTSAARPALLDVEEVPGFVLSRVQRLAGIDEVSLRAARGRVLAAAVRAPMPLPPFDHAAVDGYALPSGRLATIGDPIPVGGRIRAGDPAVDAGGEALRILTGAPVPDGIAAVVMQEHVERTRRAICLGEPVRPGANIRRVGEDVAEDELIFGGGSILDVRHVALLAALGIDCVSVVRRPSVAIIALGSELVGPGETRAPHQIFDFEFCDGRGILRTPRV